jgi:hypothetical protein
MRNKERLANKLKKLGISNLNKLNKRECPHFLTPKTALREKFNNIFIAKNITECFYEKHSLILNQAFNAGSQWSPIFRWYINMNLFLSEQLFNDYNCVDLKAQNILLQYIQAKVIDKIPETDTNLKEIVKSIRRIHARNELVLNEKEKHTRKFCLDHTNCECTILIAQICPYRNCGYFTNSIENFGYHLTKCQHFETHNVEYNEQIKIIQESNVKKKSLNLYYLQQLVKHSLEFSNKFGTEIKKLTRPYNNSQRERKTSIGQTVYVVQPASSNKEDQTSHNDELKMNSPQGIFKATVPLSFSDRNVSYDEHEISKRASVIVQNTAKTKDILAETLALHPIMYDPCFAESDSLNQTGVQHMACYSFEEQGIMTQKDNDPLVGLNIVFAFL